MRTSSAAALVAALMVGTAGLAAAQQQNQGGGLIDMLNKAINPDGQDRRSRDDQVSRGDGDRVRSGYRQLSDRELRDEASRLRDEERQIQRRRDAVDDELNRRGLR